MSTAYKLTLIAVLIWLMLPAIGLASAIHTTLWLEEVWYANGHSYVYPISLENEGSVARIVAPLSFLPDADIKLDSITISGTRLDGLGTTTTWFDNTANLLWVDFKADPGNPLPMGFGPIANIHFTVAQNAPTADVEVDTTFIAPDKSFTVESPTGPVSDLTFLPGLIHMVSHVPIIDLDPTEFAFETVEGVDPLAQILAVRNTGIDPLNWHFSYLPSWLQVSATQGTAPSDIDLMPDVSGLPIGFYEDSLAVTDSLSANHTLWAWITLDIRPPEVDSICFDLVPGWQLISWNLDTETDDIATLFADILDKLDVVLSFESGALTFDPDLMEFSTLQTADHLHGYWVRMNEAAQLCLTGDPVDPQTPIMLESNWNLAGYLPDSDFEIEIALGSIFEDFEVGLGFEGGGLVYDSDHPELATLTTLRHGYGYWLRVAQPATLVYPVASPVPLIVQQDNLMKAALVPEGVNPSPEWIDAYASELTVDGVPLEPGAVVSFYDSEDNLCGRGTISDNGVLPFTPIYRDYPASPTDEGANVDETLKIRVNDAPVAQQLVWTARGDRVELLQLSSVSGAATLPDRFSLGQNHPNPFNPETVISFSLPQSGQVKLEVFNILGERVLVLADELLPAGNYRYTWDGKDSQARRAPSGIYLYRLSAAGLSSTRKMLLLK
ncbi:MAG: FlgD immunoglobulin-like domain containing protein [bacterium]